MVVDSIVFCGQIRDVIRGTAWYEVQAQESYASRRVAVGCDGHIAAL